MNKTVKINDVVSQVEGNIVSDMDGEKVMLSIQNGKYYNLGEVGGVIWECIKEPTSIHHLVDSLITQFDVEVNECRIQVIEFLNQLVEEGLIKVETI